LMDFGMSERFENVVLSKRGAGYGGEPQLTKEYSEATQQYIDDELAKIMKTRFEYVCSMLREKKNLVDYIAVRLLEKEIIEHAEFLEIIKAESGLSEPPLTGAV
ncbi:MAG: ATP-dependent zinc metalloprotease FtsH, partial [Treponemataceae bacterium]